MLWFPSTVQGPPAEDSLLCAPLWMQEELSMLPKLSPSHPEDAPCLGVGSLQPTLLHRFNCSSFPLGKETIRSLAEPNGILTS